MTAPPSLRALGVAAAPTAVALIPALACAALIAAAGPLVAVLVAAVLAAAVVVALRPLAGVFLGIAFIPAEIFALPVGGEIGLTASEGLFVLAGLSYVVRRLLTSRSVLVPSPITWPLVAFLAALVPGLLVAAEIFPVVKTLVMWTLFACAAWLVMADRRRETVERLLIILAVSGAAVAVFAVVTAGPQTLSNGGQLAEGRASGAFGSPNTLASFLALALPGALALGLRGSGSFRPIALACTGAIFFGLAMSLSRGGLLAAIGALGFMLLWAPVRKVATVGAVGVLLLTLNGAAVIERNEPIARVTERLATVGGTSSNLGEPRFIMWPRLPAIFAERPVFGIGTNQFAHMAERRGLVDPLLDESFGHAHNLVFNIAIELGIVGLAAFLWLVVALARTCLAACRAGPERERGPAFAVSAALVAFTLHSVVDVTLRTNVIAALVFLLAACAVVLAPVSPARRP